MGLEEVFKTVDYVKAQAKAYKKALTEFQDVEDEKKKHSLELEFEECKQNIRVSASRLGCNLREIDNYLWQLNGVCVKFKVTDADKKAFANTPDNLKLKL